MITVVASIEELEIGKIYDQTHRGGSTLWNDNREEVHEFRMQVLAKATREEWEQYCRDSCVEPEEAIRDSDITIRLAYKNHIPTYYKVSFD